MQTIQFLAVAGLIAVSVAVAGPADVDEDATELHYRAEPGSEWREDTLALPDFPRPKALVELELARGELPFSVFVDTDSVSVGDDYIVRYTVVLRSARGAENVSYEGIRCTQRQFKRYAYGSGGRLQPSARPEWRYIRSTRQDAYRRELADHYFCPLPSGNTRAEIVKKLKRSSIDAFTDHGEQ